MKKLILFALILSSCSVSKINVNHSHKEFMIYEIVNLSNDIIGGPTYANFEQAPNPYYINDIFSTRYNSMVAILPINDLPENPKMVMSPTINNGFVKFEIKILNKENIMLKPIEHIKGNVRADNKYLYFPGSLTQYNAIVEITDFKTVKKYF